MRESSFSLTYKDEKTKGGVLWESHCHARFELIAVFEGEVSLTFEGRKTALSHGSVTVIPPLVYHTITAKENTHYRRATVLFDLSFVPHPLKEQFLAHANAGKALCFSDLSSLQRVSPLAEQDFYRPLAESLLIGLLYEYTEAASAEAGVADDSFLTKTLSFIDTHLCEKISLDEIALRTARSKSSLCHLFREKMGVTVKQYVIEKRMALATKMMREGELPTAVAAAVGYDNYSNFYRIYQKHFGEPPSFLKKP